MRFSLPVDSEVRERLERLEIPFNEYGVDPYGISKSHLGPSFTALRFFYRHYFSVESHGIEHVPRAGARCSSATTPAASRSTGRWSRVDVLRA